MAEELKKKKKKEDPRIELICSYVCKTMRIKIEKWQKMVSSEDHVLNQWLANSHLRLMIISSNNSGTLMSSLSFPTTCKGKICYFIRKEPVEITIKNYKEVVFFGDMSPHPVDDLSILVDEVFFPLLNNQLNQESWPDVVVKDVLGHIQELRSIVAEVKGNIINQTILPMPITIDHVIQVEAQILDGFHNLCDSKMKNSIEGIVIKWSAQIDEVLKEDSSVIFMDTLYPVPSHEVSFWKSRLVNLKNIYNQLTDLKVKAVGNILMAIDSVYYSLFSTAFKNTVTALYEAQDITLWLNPFKKITDIFETMEFLKTKKYIKALLHCMCLIWGKSLYYSKNSRISILFIMIGNMLIAESSKNLDPGSLFQGDIDEGLIKIEETIDLLELYKTEYEIYRNKLDEFKEIDTNPVYWSFQRKTIFGRLDIYLKRLYEIKNIFSIANAFAKLEKIEIGGIRGKFISREMAVIFESFQNLFCDWMNIIFDPVDPNPDLHDFSKQYDKFNESAQILERTLASLFAAAFDDCFNASQIIKLAEMAGSLLYRPLILAEIETKYEMIIEYFSQDLDLAKFCFEQAIAKFRQNGTEGLPIDRGYTPIAGTMTWISKFKKRIKSYDYFTYIDIPVFKSEEGVHVLSKMKEMMETLLEFEREIYNNWASSVGKQITKNMKLHLLTRNNDELLILNFNEELQITLKEIRLLKSMKKESIPREADELQELVEPLYETRIMLARIVEWYNEIKQGTENCEFNLIRAEIKNFDDKLNEVLNQFKWSNYNQTYINQIYDEIHNVQLRVLKARTNLIEIKTSIQSWGYFPLYKRIDGINDNLLNIEDRSILVTERIKACLETNDLIKQKVEENFRLFNNIPLQEISEISKFIEKDGADINEQNVEMNGKTEENEQILQEKNILIKPVQLLLFQTYKEYLDEIISNEIINAIQLSIKYLQFEMEDRYHHGAPIFEVRLELQEPDIVFVPSLDKESSHGFMAMVEEIFMDIYNMADLISRVVEIPIEERTDENDEIQDATYSTYLSENLIIEDIRALIVKNVRATMRMANDYVKKYQMYKYLWKDDKKMYLKQFNKYARALTIEEMTKIGTEFDVKENYPTLENYKEKIDQYNMLYVEVRAIEHSHNFNTWLLIDMSYFKFSLLNHISVWGNLFKQHLVDHVVNSLQKLENFINDGLKILNIKVLEEDFKSLLKVMSTLSGIKDREIETDNMFQPLKSIVELLKQYHVDFSETIHDQFIHLPEQWLKMKKMALHVKQEIAPVQAYQVELISKRITLFDFRVNLYRQNFKRLGLFHTPCPHVYDLCDIVNKELFALEQQLKVLKTSAALFELNPPNSSKLEISRKELKMIKQLWDFVYSIESRINNWKETPFKKMDVEKMEQNCKDLGKDIRKLDKDMRYWNPYVYLEGILKNLMTSLRAITTLQNPAIRERHWMELMRVTNVQFSMDESTTLSHLLDLKLHRYEEEVKYIVDKAVKEMVMEKTIKDVDATWSIMEFEYDIHERTKLIILRVSEELIETLEENQVQLHNLLSSKYIGFFGEEVSKWQAVLSTTDQIITVWFEVQRKWMYLESIFVGSEDIRAQLPTDSRRFDNIDIEFRIILAQLSSSSNVVEVTNKPKLYERLENIFFDLILCEKALNEYLETKRLAFPRFYFVSSADLLDILSNGNNPVLISRHLTKLFDSIGKLKLSFGNATGMISKEHHEYVEFKQKCDCSGKVEIWLNRVTDSMRFTLHKLFYASIHAYEDKPRDGWIFDWPAQTALCGTQIWWTTDVNLAFGRLEEGYENALKDYNKKQILQLNALIVLLLGDLTPGDRQKIMTVCTIDVHSRDVVAKLITQKIEKRLDFQWQSQLRHRWDSLMQDCFANICDAQFRYDYEYLGNTPRLVITPLTDRCYITLTQSLHLIMGGAPAGPAGTGKTETTKDLGRALGVMVYVFNCSEQMDYKSCGNIYKGLAQTGAWGCFDEFNRISVEVLSVVAVQVKTIQDAIKGGKKYATLDDHADKTKKLKFNFMGENISLVPTVGIFITMNPGYAGRTELPENLKALFRPCAMVVPDFALICEIMLVAEGFQEARLLARKFISLYTLCKELLSKQDHYDWGLRAIKSVLVVAGSLKRGDRQRPEDQVLMRALRDFNTPKIVTEDVPVFMGLIGDLFPALDVPRKRSSDFEKLIKKSAADLKLQPEDGYVLKVVQLEELFTVRHSVFIVGNAGTGKTEIWRGLFRTYQNQKRKPYYNDLNPKAVTNDELFGIINPATREWKDGLFSAIMRDQANMAGTGPRWIVLDGDIDPMWIESLNTVMDDNKVLTLASNERIALTAEMRLLFEIGNLRAATPATVSRAGILYINPLDLGWNPFVASWIESRDNQAEKTILTSLFDKYIPITIDAHKKYKKITPISDIAMIQMTCYLLDCFLTPVNVPTECPKEWYEIYFVFATIWGFGSSLFQDQLIDWRVEFNKWWINEFKAVKYPPAGTIFNYYIDPETKEFLSWSELVPGFELDIDVPLQFVLVPTTETTRLNYFLNILIAKNHPVMLIGGAGSGKSVILADKLRSLSESYAITNVPFNFYTTSEMLQNVLEKPLEKKAGRNYGPSGGKKMIYFIDDMNMPEIDYYGTVQPHTIIRQFMDYQHWYDRSKLSLKDIHNCQFVSCMNPTAGAFTIDTRLQRHFCVFAVNFPEGDPLFQIYNSILAQHLGNQFNQFSHQTFSVCSLLVNTALSLHTKVGQIFLPTAVKFHYIFNLRDLANIFQGVLFANGDTCPDPNSLIRLWLHEARRVYGDKLMDDKDIQSFNKVSVEVTRNGFEGFHLEETKVFATPLVYCHFANGLTDLKYMPVNNWVSLSCILDEAQLNYNETIGALNLVLFEDAMAHICRISRILESPRGNALLIGVGGSGKQSLARLAAFISNLTVTQIQLKKGYNETDLKLDLASIYTKVGLKNMQQMFLMTDAQVAEESFLVLINDMLASGEITDLLPEEDIENVINAVRNEVKELGILDNNENCWKYFIDKVRKMLKTILCFSPVGSILRVRARKFPAIVNCTTIDWFHEWPINALESVSQKFLSNVDTLPTELINSVSKYMAYVHETVNEVSKIYLKNEKRYNYTTPKTFLELISLYSKLLTEKTIDVNDRIARLENGILKLKECGDQVDSLQIQLESQEIVLRAKNEAADKLIVVVSAENEKVQKEKNYAAREEAKVRTIEEDVTIKARICEEDLRKAEPALIAAQEALNTLNKNNLTELKSFGAPPQAVINVCSAVVILFSPKGKISKDRSWKAAKILMGKVDQFLYDLINYDKEHIKPSVIAALTPYLKNPEFDPKKILSKSAAAAGLCAWVININKFYEVYLYVEPKQRALQEAQNELQSAQDKLEFLNRKIIDLEEKLSIIQAEFDAAMTEKRKCQIEADKTTFTIDLAHRLVGGLASENLRWIASIASFKQKITMLPGDALLISCFISYVGCFSRRYRIELQEKMWIPTIQTIEPLIPYTAGIDLLELICDDAQIAIWNNEGLPNDRMSTENATILTNSARWPLMIDPQLQGFKWIKQKFGNNITVISLTQKDYLESIEKAVTNGKILLIENIGENLDAVLEPLLGRALIKKGKVLKIGEKEVDYDPRFRLILQTKLANPHYKPEIQAQTTIINFTVTRDGLEEQLLAEVVKAERPDLEQLKTELTMQQNTFKITLKVLEGDLLQRLASAGKNVLDDPTLVLNLEKTKKTAEEIEVKVKEARITSIEIDIAREHYRSAAERASILYFILNDLHRINPIYQFSLKAFIVVFKTAISKAIPNNILQDRVVNLIESITFSVFMYTCRGLFEKDKLIFMAQTTIQILLQSAEIKQIELDFLLRFPNTTNIMSPFEFLSNTGWGAIKTLSTMESFRNLDKDIEGSSKRWNTFVESECPEKERFPGEWKNKTAIQRLCIIRALRPDRMTYAVRVFVEEKLGAKYVKARTVEFSRSFKETNSSIPIFFILSPGVDPLVDVEKLGKKLKFSSDYGNFYNVSLGQGQEIVAEDAIDKASIGGHWVILQNIHLVAKWLPILEKKMETTQEGSNENYRLFISAEPASAAEYHVIPQGILESAIKITNEPPTGMLANIHKSLECFNQETLEMCSKEAEFKAILFSLCYFHAVIAERRKFGPQGWNRVYPYNFGDLTICAYVLQNYLEGNPKVPWDDLRYLFGEIMYGGHITDDWDRRLCKTYLEEFMQPELIDGDLLLCTGFLAPPNTDYSGYHKYIDEYLPPESPYLYGLHPNAEIGFLTNLSDQLFKTILELQPRDSGNRLGQSISREDTVKMLIEDIVDKLPEEFNMTEICTRVENRTPYIIVAFQECERMNILFTEIKRSLKELTLGLKGELTITLDMENLEEALFFDNVLAKWERLAYPSLLGLQSWFADLMLRVKELELWSVDFALPSSVWLAGFFNPQSFLTAIMQQTARKNEWPLDRMCLSCDVTKKQKEDFNTAPREGAYVNSLFMEGAKWDTTINAIGLSKLKELFPMMPVIFIKAITKDKQETRNIYECPVYKTRERGPTFVWTFNLKTKEKAAKWILGGVCLLLQV